MRKIKIVRILAALCAATSLLTVPAFGQERFGALRGVTSDETDAVLPGAAVTLTNKATGRVLSTTGGADGTYLVPSVESGQYSVRFALAGFAPMDFPNINISVGQTLKLDVKMKVGSVLTTVQVTDVVTSVETQGGGIVHSVSEDQFERLPKSRTFQYFAITAPAVNTGEIEGGIQVNGASGAENTFSIDGFITNSGIDGRSRQNAAFEYLQEVQIKTAGVEAEYAGALGGVISAVTKSGGDQFHGSAWLYASGSRLSAGPVKRLVLDPRDNLTVSYLQDRKDQNSQFEPGFSFGGPIRRNKLYFYTSWGSSSILQDRAYAFSNGAENGIIRRDRTSATAFNKILFDPSPRVHTSFTWLWTPTTSTGGLPAYNGACPNCLSSTEAANALNTTRGFFAPQSSATGNIDVAVSPNILVNARAGYFWDNYRDTGIPDGASVQYQAPAQGPLVPPEFQGPVGYQNKPAALKQKHDLLTRAYFEINVSLQAGSHHFKAGFGTQKTVNDVDISYPGGYVFVWWDRSFQIATTPPTPADRGAYGYYEVNDRGTIGSAGDSIKSLYFQDRWRLSERLSLNLGLRAESEHVPSFRPDLQSTAFSFGWSEKIAPRLGANFDVYGNGKLKLFGGWGRYYDWTKYEIARTAFGGARWRTYYRSLDTPDVFSLSLLNMPGRDLWKFGGAFQDHIVPTFGERSVDRDLKPTSQDQWWFGGNYQWKAGTVVSMRYLHQKLRRAVDDLAARVLNSNAFVYANPGEGVAVTVPFATGLTTLPLQYPKPVRTYDAVVFSMNGRLGNNWFGEISYTWSRLYGNYSGLSSSDEIRTPTTGVSSSTAQQEGGSIARPGSYANYGWDLDEMLFDSKGNFDPKGRLATDRTHVVKLSGAYEFKWGRVGTTNVGVFSYLGSGTPLSTVVNTLNHLPVLVNGRGDMGRSPVLSTTDLQIAHKFRLTEGHTVRIEFNALNAFNQKTSRHRFDNLNRGAGVAVNSSAISLANANLRNGYDYNVLLGATPDGPNAYDPRYGMDDLFTEGFAARVGVKWSF